MRIAFVYDAVYPYLLGGGEKRVWEMARRLVARGHEVHLFGMQFWEGEQTITREGVVLHGVCRPYSFYRNGRRRILPAFIFGVMVFLALFRERFDVVDCQQFPYTSVFGSAAACRISRSPFVITWYEVWGDYWYEYLGRIGAGGKVLERLAARVPAHTVAISETTKAGLVSMAGDREITVLPIGIDTDEIDSVLPAKTQIGYPVRGEADPGETCRCAGRCGRDTEAGQSRDTVPDHRRRPGTDQPRRKSEINGPF